MLLHRYELWILNIFDLFQPIAVTVLSLPGGGLCRLTSVVILVVTKSCVAIW